MLYDNKAILDKARQLAKMIAESPEVDFFKRAEAQIKKNKRVQELIAQIRAKQKEAVLMEEMGRHDSVKNIEKEIEIIQDELDSIPIVQEFQQSQADVNDLLQMVSNVISNTVTEEIILSTGGDPLKGKTGGEEYIPEGSGCCHNHHK